MGSTVNRSILIATVLSWTTYFSTGQAAVIESVNGTALPNPTSSWAAADEGWLYTPGLSYTLTGIDTKFRTTDGRTVTVEVYSDLPSNGGTLLRSAPFLPAASIFSGGLFPGLAVSAGHSFFIGFRNVAGLGVNTTTAAQGLQSLGPDYYDFDGTGTYALHFPFTTGDVDRPILSLNGTAIPEPATYGFIVIGICLAITRRRLSMVL